MKGRTWLITVLLSSALLSSCDIVTEGHPDARVTAIPLLETYLTPENYDVLQTNRMLNLSVPIGVYYGKIQITGHVRAQGHGSRYRPKWSFEIDCDDNKVIEGLSQFKLSAQVWDSSMIKTALVTYVYETAGFPLFKSMHVFLKMNGVDRGLYVLEEGVDSSFFKQRQITIAEVIAVNNSAEFTFSILNDLRRNFKKEIPDDGNFGNLADLIHALDVSPPTKVWEEVGKYLDIRNYLRYHALTTVVNNTDAFNNNFYLYKTSPTVPYKVIPWDFDNAFNASNDAGFYGKNEIIQALLKNDSCFTIYKAELQNALTTVFTESRLYPMIDSVAARIRSAYNLDPYLGLAGISLDQECASLKTFITNRRTYLLSNLGNYSR